MTVRPISGDTEAVRSTIDRKSETWWDTAVRIFGNGEFEVDIADQVGNHTLQRVTVDWWKDKIPAWLQTQAADPPAEETADNRWMTAELTEGENPTLRVSISSDASTPTTA